MADQNPLVDKLIETVNRHHWPSAHRMDARALRAYTRGLDQVNAYRGDPAIYFDALRTFSQTESTAFASAGVAFTLTMASSGRKPYLAGFEEAIRWLEKAQEWEPDFVDINFIEAVIYLNTGQIENGRLVLDHLSQQEADNYYVCLTEMNYWQQKNANESFVKWLRKASNKLANKRLRQAYTLNALAHLYLSEGRLNNALEIFTDITKLTPDDPWAWHNMSYIFLELDKVKEAKQCNERALGIMDFQSARDIQEKIRQQRGGLSRLFRK